VIVNVNILVITQQLTWPASHQMDLLWATERIPVVETDPARVSLENGNEYLQWDAWAAALSGFLEPQFLLSQCPSAVAYAWPAAHMRISAVFTFVDPKWAWFLLVSVVARLCLRLE